MIDDFIGVWRLEIAWFLSPGDASAVRRRDAYQMQVEAAAGPTDRSYDATVSAAYSVRFGIEGSGLAPPVTVRRRRTAQEVSILVSIDSRLHHLDGKLVEGVLVGRISDRDVRKGAAVALAYVTGWNATHLDSLPDATGARRVPQLMPRVWELRLALEQVARARIDTDGADRKRGRITYYGGARDPQPYDCSKVLEYELSQVTWDGQTLSYVDPATGQTFVGIVDPAIPRRLTNGPGNTLAGWDYAYRAEVLGFGLPSAATVPRLPTWRARARAQLSHLITPPRAGLFSWAPPDVVSATDQLGRQANPVDYLDPVWTGLPQDPAEPPPTIVPWPADRDDFPHNPPPPKDRPYRVVQFKLNYTSADPVTGAARAGRTVLAYLTIPNDLAGKTRDPAHDALRRVVVAVNGNDASADKHSQPGVQVYSGAICMLSPNGPQNQYWYGDAFASRGFIVLAIDIAGDGATPETQGNGVRDAGKLCDIRAMLDFLANSSGLAWNGSRDQIQKLFSWMDVSRVMIVGQSMGGRLALKAAALDSRFIACVAGWASDLAARSSAHAYDDDPTANRPDAWRFADASEYFNMTEVEGLILSAGPPAGLLINYSGGVSPTTILQQQSRRTREFAAVAGQPTFVEYVHSGGDAFRWGGQWANGTKPGDAGICEPQFQTPQQSSAWQTQLDRNPALAADLGQLIDQGRTGLPPFFPAPPPPP